MQEPTSLEMLLKKYYIASKTKQSDMIQSALAVLGGRPAERLLYSGADACRLLSMSQSSLWRLRKLGKIVPVHPLGRPKYRRTDLERLAAGEVKP